MSRLLSELLAAPEPAFSLAIRRLEQASGHPGSDIRLVADMKRRSHQKITELGLDPEDTTANELYAAIVARAGRDNTILMRHLGLDEHATTDTVIQTVLAAVSRLDNAQDAWVLKHSVIKRLLRDRPPKHMMKLLGYKSVDSLLKREPIGAICSLIRFTEPLRWQQGLLKSYVKLVPGDFEQRPVELHYINEPRWQKLAQDVMQTHRHAIAYAKETGAVAILPVPIAEAPALGLAILSLVLRALHEIRVCSTFVKLQQVKPDFGQRFVHALSVSVASVGNLNDYPVSWRALQRLYARKSIADFPSFFDPYVQPEDISWQQADTVLPGILPDLAFWRDTDHLGTVIEGQPVVFNVLDAALNYCNGVPFQQRITVFAREALHDELLVRYLQEPKAEQQIVTQLDVEFVPDDFWHEEHVAAENLGFAVQSVQ